MYQASFLLFKLFLLKMGNFSRPHAQIIIYLFIVYYLLIYLLVEAGLE